jgi:hypothetical protein
MDIDLHVDRDPKYWPALWLGILWLAACYYFYSRIQKKLDRPALATIEAR